MKVNLLLMTLLFAILTVFTVSCDNGSETKECTQECGAWQECNTKTGTCEAKNGFCDSNDDCDNGRICGNTHKCKEPVPEECKNQCLDQNGVQRGTCSMVQGKPSCECQDGYLLSPNGLRCLEPLEECNNEATACGGHGECIANNNGTLGCKCDEDYITSPNDPMVCEGTETCSNSNHNGSCEASCEKCMENENGDWECMVPPGERGCYGGFNDKCDPSLGWFQNPNCGSRMVCEGETADDAYCTVIDCQADSDCEKTYNENFTCTSLGQTSDGQKFGECIKGADFCFNEDGTRIGGGKDGDRCSDACKDAQCDTGLKCIGGVCSRTCNGLSDDSCLQAVNGTRKCVNNSIFSDLTDFRCAFEAGLGESCFNGEAACGDGLICLGDQQTWAKCFKECSDADGDGYDPAHCGDGVACNVLRGENPNKIGYCDAPRTAHVGEPCEEGVVGCVDDGWCLGSSMDDMHCYAKCTAEAESSEECGGNACLKLGDGNGGIAGYYCEPSAPKTQELGEECNDFTAACKNDAYCLRYQGESTGHCFAKCTTESDASSECEGNKACLSLGTGSDFYCEPNAAAVKNPGETCDPFNGCVEGSTCLTLRDGGSFCFKECAQDSDCSEIGNGSTCLDFGEVGHFCGAPKTAQEHEECGIIKDCADGLLCLTYPGADSGYCYKSCTDNNGCSAEETCMQIEGGAFCKPECMDDVECSVDKICSKETFTCVTPQD